MKANVGGIDRAIRILLGIALIGVGIYAKLLILDVLGVVALGTGLMSHCLLYRLFGFSTAGKK